MGFSQEEIINELPVYLRQFVATQDYSSCYTPRDQAVWRYVMRQLSNHLKDTAHPIYLEGLKKTGISIETIPSIEEMNECLSKIGWKAVVVDGFIPPQAFMELQELKVLAIALDMRTIEHILYTPAPDIVHESAGHAPIIIDEEYSEYLQRFGEIGVKAMFTKEDKAVYEAIRHLSIIKEFPETTEEEIKEAERSLEEKMNSVKNPSESALLTRLHWWTVEYGLVGSVDDYKIFGAGLLSSLGESESCLDDKKVKKIPLTLDAINTPYDITTRQPQLFVTKSCRHLTQVLEDFADQMCFRKGGAESVKIAIDCNVVSTLQYSSGLQVSGVVSRLLTNAAGKEIYIGTEGPTQLAYNSKELSGHGTEYHAHGFGSPVGQLCNLMKPLEDATEYDLITLNIKRESRAVLEFVSGVRVDGFLNSITKKDGKLVLMSFSECTVISPTGEILFDPSWGIYDMAIGKRISSVYSGSADKETFNVYGEKPSEGTKKVTYTEKQKNEFQLYQEIRTLRSSGTILNTDVEKMYRTACDSFPNSWLIFIELLELADHRSALYEEIKKTLSHLSEDDKDVAHLIARGISLIESESELV